MTDPATAVVETKNPLDAAQKIVADLRGMSKEDQSLALKFAIETLKLVVPTCHTASASVPGHAASPTTTMTGHATGHVTDLKIFKEQKQPKSDQQFTAVVAYYYRFLAPVAERRETIDGEVMTHAARGVWPQKKRWSMTLTNAKNAGYLDPAERGSFKLSAIGENLVAMTLPGDGSIATPAVGGGIRKKATRKKTTKKATKKTN